jgi:TonB family protein
MQRQLETRLGVVDLATNKSVKRGQKPLFVVQRPGLAAPVNGTASAGDEILSAFQNQMNYITSGNLAKTPAKADFVFPVGEFVRIRHAGIAHGKTTKWLMVEIETAQSHTFTAADGDALPKVPIGRLAFEIPPDQFERRDYAGMLNAVFEWIAPQNPSGLALADERPTPASPPEESARAPVPQPSVEQIGAAQAPSASAAPVQLQEGQTPADVEKLLGKPEDTITLQESLVYIYPTVKVIFERNKLMDVQPRSLQSKEVPTKTQGPPTREEPPILDIPPEINLPNYGDPLGRLGIPSLGNGIGSGIGNGRGAGVGPGSGGGFGGGAYRIGGGVSAPSVLLKVEPEYSEEARMAKWQGTVVLSLIVDERGQPQDVRVVRALGLGLDQKAIECVQKWRFKPGMKDGKPVPVMSTIEVNFRLL